MKHALLAFLLILSLVSPAQTVHPHHRPTAQRTAAAQPAATPKVYVCGGGSAYAYHSSDGCAGLNRCSHGVSAVTVAEAEGMGRRPCKKCY
jgi:uridylate kinase